MAALLLGGFALVLATVLLVAHRIPFYGVETDLFGEYIPAARALLSGQLTAAAYEFKGPGYPLLLALSSLLTFGDAWLAARLLNLVSAVVAAGFTFLLARRALGEAAAVFVLAALCVNPLFVTTTVEAGTDMPTLALSLAATWFVLGARDARGAALAGFLAGFAVLCRYNAGFLVPAALVAILLAKDRATSRGMLAAAYVLGFALPIAPWLVVNHRLTGNAFTNRNYTNLAFELYGNGMAWDRFWAEVAPRFGSFADVVAYDPAAAALHWLRNLATRWTADLRQLVPPWLGVVAALGALLHARRAAGGARLLVHFAFCYATLTLVFYTPRFFLYLVPFYLTAAALAFFPRGTRLARFAPWLAVAAAGAVVGSAVLAVRATAALLRDQPVEIVAAGRVLRPLAQPGDRILARKPQVAYFAGMAYEPLPQAESLRRLLAEGRAAGARYLIFSGIEASQRPQFRLLSEPDLALPGYTPLARDVSDPDHHYTLYRLEPAGPSDAAFSDSMRSALRALAARNPDSPEIQGYAGAMLWDEGDVTAARACFDRAVELAPGSVQARAFRAMAHLESGAFDAAARDCEQVIASLARPSAVIHLMLGHIRLGQGRDAEALEAFEVAGRAEPASVQVQLQLALARLALGPREAGRAALDQSVRLAPGLAPVRELARTRADAGDRASLVRMLELVRRTARTTAPLESVIDSVRADGGSGPPGRQR